MSKIRPLPSPQHFNMQIIQDVESIRRDGDSFLLHTWALSSEDSGLEVYY
jgi:hypothetical protein